MAFLSVVDAESAMAVARSSRSAAATPRTGAEIRAAFLSFYEERGHKVMASASLIPEDPHGVAHHCGDVAVQAGLPRATEAASAEGYQ